MTDPVSAAPLSRSQRIHRMRARSWALQILYEWESQQDRRTLPEVMDGIVLLRRISPDRIDRVKEHVAAVAGDLPRIDGILREAMHNWKLERLSRVDRSVLRLAVAELIILRDVPPKVVIQEAIRLAGQYGGNESPGFVNGVLDAVFRTHLRDP